MKNRPGILFVLSGPSGAGKGTVLKAVMDRMQGLAVSVSATTRAPRQGEIDGVHYYFKTKEEFENMLAAGEFLEHIHKFENQYGTPKAPVEKMLAEGKDVVLEIETRGSRQVRKIFPKAVLIFITPGSSAELSKRLDTRGSETEKAKRARLKMANQEYKSMRYYDYVVINDDLNVSVPTVEAIITAERCKYSRNPGCMEEFVNNNKKEI